MEFEVGSLIKEGGVASFLLMDNINYYSIMKEMTPIAITKSKTK